MNSTVTARSSLVCLEVETIIVPIRPDYLTVPGRDMIVRSVAGDIYHNRIEGRILEGIGNVVLGDRSWHKGGFNNVIFWGDEGGHQVSDMVCNALLTANFHRFEQVALPLLRTSSKDNEEDRKAESVKVIQATLKGINAFWKSPKAFAGMEIFVCIPDRELNQIFRNLKTEFDRDN